MVRGIPLRGVETDEGTKTLRKHSPLSYAAVGLVLFLALALRFQSVRDTHVIHPLRADAGHYFMYAYNLRHKHVYSGQIGDPEDLHSPVSPDAVRPPGYPLFLAPFVDGLPNKNLIHRILTAQVILSVLTLLFSFLFFRSFIAMPVALAASLLVALSPHLIVSNSYLLTETLFCFLLVLAAWVLSLFMKKPSLWLGGTFGVLIGVASLVRPSLQYFPVVVGLYWIGSYGWRRGLRFSIVLLLGFVLCFSPWIARNLITLASPSDKTLMINFLHHGMYPHFTFAGIAESYGFPYRFDPRASEISRDLPSVLKEISSRFAEEPITHLQWFLLEKPVAFWSWNMVQGAGDAFIYPVTASPYFHSPFFRWSHHFMHVLHWPLVILASFTCLMTGLPLHKIGVTRGALFVVRMTSLLLVYYTALHMIGAPFPRYSIPLRPFVYGLALFTPWVLFLGVRSRFKDRIEPHSRSGSGSIQSKN